jgi:hypothetical protein
MGDGRSRRLASLPLVAVFLVIGGLEAAPHLGDLFHRTARATVATAPPSPSRSAAAGPVPAFGRVPPNVDVFWLIGRGGRWMVAYDWSGRPVGALDRVASSASPNGQRLWADGAFFDAQGDFLTRTALPNDAFTWSTASDGVCGYTAGLWTYRLAELKVRRVVSLPDTDGGVAACSFGHDLALVTSGAPDKPRTLWWVRLSTGAVLAKKEYPPDDLGDVVVSRDLRYFAENYYSVTRPVTYGIPPDLIRRVEGDAPVTQRRDLVTAFSGDSTEIATVLFDRGVVGVFKLSGEEVWKADRGAEPDLYAGPTGAEFVGEQLRGGVLSVVVVHGDGTATAVVPPEIDSILKPG